MIRFGFEFKSRKARDNYVDNLLEIKRELNLGSAIEISMSTLISGHQFGANVLVTYTQWEQNHV